MRIPLLAFVGLAACSPDQPGPAAAVAVIAAAGETVAVGTADADAADDPAIWRNPTEPAASLIIGTDKKAGLYVYGLDGRVRDFVNAGRVNNVAVADLNGRIIVAASDRNDVAEARIALFSLDSATAKLTPIGAVPVGKGEAYGICVYQKAGVLYAFIVLKNGALHQIALDISATSAPTGKLLRSMKLASQSEGCAVDAGKDQLYVAEEDVGIWRFDARPDGDTAPVAFTKVDGQRLVADVEGIALADGYLIASSQGSNSYAVYSLSDGGYRGSFKIGGGGFGATEETDGIEIVAGNFGPLYPGGLMVAQDGLNAPAAQNFKLVSWNAIKSALSTLD